MTEDFVKKLAGDHWRYVETTLMTHGVSLCSDQIKIARYHYIAAFQHGFKHGLEASQRYSDDDLLLDDTAPL
jgi:hypothetical protein